MDTKDVQEEGLIGAVNLGKIQNGDMGNKRHNFSGYTLRPIYHIILFPSAKK